MSIGKLKKTERGAKNHTIVTEKQIGTEKTPRLNELIYNVLCPYFSVEHFTVPIQILNTHFSVFQR